MINVAAAQVACNPQVGEHGIPSTDHAQACACCDSNTAARDASFTLAEASKVAPVAAVSEWHDFRDRGDAMIKVYPTIDWRGWERRQDMDHNTGER